MHKAEESEIKLPIFTGSQKQQENSRKTSTSVSLTMLKPLTVWIVTNSGNLLKRREYQTILLFSWETCMWVKKQELEPCMEQLIGSGLRKECDRAVCCHPVCLTYMLSTSWEMPGWVCYKPDQDRWEKYQQFQICGWYHPNGRKWRRTKELLDEGEGGE